MRVVFDQPIFDRPLDPANWTGRTGGPLGALFVGVGTPSVSYRTVTVEVQLGVPQAGPGRVSYAAAPADVANRYLETAAAFVNFPLS